MRSVSCVSPAEIENIACPSPDAGDILSTLARMQKHVGQFVCEVDRRDAGAWESIARDFEYEGGEISPASRQEFSHLLLWRHGKAVAGARVAISKLPGLRRGHAIVRGGPFWHAPDANPDPAIYRAALGAIVQEYCIRRGHRLTIIPHAGGRLYAQEALALRLFGFAGKMTGGYAFRMPSSRRIMSFALGILPAMQRTILGRYGRA